MATKLYFIECLIVIFSLTALWYYAGAAHLNSVLSKITHYGNLTSIIDITKREITDIRNTQEAIFGVMMTCCFVAGVIVFIRVANVGRKWLF